MVAMITLRVADARDAPQVFAWRNDPHTRAASVATGEIGWDEHEAWFARSLEASHRTLYVAEDPDADGAGVGMVRFDHDDADTAEVSINLNPAYRGRGLGLQVLTSAIAMYDDAMGGLALIATIRGSNAASIRLFEAAGFGYSDAQDAVGGFLTYRRPGRPSAS
jgi:RimJ/RimL family protein N-acetyltransferase